jgi:hypothetical protein
MDVTDFVHLIQAEKELLRSGAERPSAPRADFESLKRDILVRMTAKVERYIDYSLELIEQRPQFDGLAPTELSVEPTGELIVSDRTAAIDQQRQLCAAATAMMIDPQYADDVLPKVVEWHEAFVRNFVVDGPKVRAAIVAGDHGIVRDEPAQRAHLRFTYALQGSALLARALRLISDRSPSPEPDPQLTATAKDIAQLCHRLGTRFYVDYSDHPATLGRYLLYPRSGESPLPGLSHNDSQSYLIEGMASLAALDSDLWLPRLDALLAFIGTQRDQRTGLLHEFDFPSGHFEAELVRSSPPYDWQAQDGHETVVLGHTIAGLYTGPARLIAASASPQRQRQMTELVDSLIDTLTRIRGIHDNMLLANAFQLLPAEPGYREMDWREGAWQIELLWQFLFHADRVGVDLGDCRFSAASSIVPAVDFLEQSLRFHDTHLFNGLTYVTENGDDLKGRRYAAPINHAADTLRALAMNLGLNLGPLA